MARNRTSRHVIDPWAAYVDVLSTLLLVIVFLLAIFVLTEFFLANALSGRDRELKSLSAQIAELAEQLAMERRESADLRANMAQLQATLGVSEAERAALALRVDALTRRAEGAEAELALRTDEIRVQLAEVESLKRDIEALRKLRAELESQVAQATGEASQLRDRTRELEARLASEQERTSLAQKELKEREIRLAELQSLYFQTDEKLQAEAKVSAEARAQVQLLNQQILELRRQLARIEAALAASEQKDKESQAQIADLGRRLNLALAQKVEELSQYRSEFFGELRKILGNRPDIQIVGDRFVLQSEVLFAVGSADLSDAAKRQLAQIAQSLVQISRRIPDRLPWVLRVDGHTDPTPIRTSQFPSNWELSTARAVAVTKYLITQGVPPNRVAATGFGEFQPLDPRADEIGNRRNRRIELKLTDR